MKDKLLLLFLSLNIAASAQSWEFNTGIHLNNFYDLRNEIGYQSVSYTPKFGYSLNVSINDIYLIDETHIRFTLELNRYGGGVKASEGGQAGHNLIDGQIEKTVLRFGFYPMNFGNKKRLNINIGPTFSLLINEKIKGTYDRWYLAHNEYGNIIVVESSGNLSERYDSYSARYYFGMDIRVAYDIQLSENLYLVPQYSLHVGFTNEFTELPEGTKSINNMLGIGIKRRL